MPSNVWADWLEDFPQALYGAMQPAVTPRQQQYWGGQYGNVWQDYMRRLGLMALGGQPPGMMFGEFLRGYPFSDYWGQLTPGQRGERISLYPGLKWNL